MKRDPLTARQLFWTAFLTMFPTILLLLPGDLLRYGGRDAFWTPLAAGVPAAALVWVVGALASHQGELTAACFRGLGPVVGRVVLAGVLAALAVYTVVATREYAQVAFVTFVFEDVPLWLLTAMGLVVAGMAAWLGLTVIARGAEIIAPLLLLVGALLLVAALPFSHALWARPLLPRNPRFAGVAPIALTWVWLVEPLMATLMLEHATAAARRVAGRTLAAATALAALATAVGLWVIVADFGPARAAELVLPLFNLTKEMAFGSFLQHLEVVLIPVALMGGAGKMAIFYWLFARAGERLTGASGRLWLVAGLIGLGAASVLLFGSVIAVGQALRSVVTPWAMPVLVGCMAAGYGAAALRRTGGGA